MVRTTPPKVDKVDTSSAEAPMAQALVALPGSKALDDNSVDDDADLLNFTAVVSWNACRMTSQLQRCWSNSGKLDCPVWDSLWFGFHAP
jgi:hypothetical protein